MRRKTHHADAHGLLHTERCGVAQRDRAHSRYGAGYACAACFGSGFAFPVYFLSDQSTPPDAQSDFFTSRTMI